MAHNHLVHPASCACGKSELDLFSVPPTQTAIESSQWVEYRPITTLSDSSPIEFVITGSGEEYVDLSESYLQVTAKILKPNGGDLVQTKGSDGTVTGDDADVGPVNLWLHSLFSQVDVSLNERLVTPSMNTYPYRAYLETLLSYGPAAKESYLTAAMWYKDTAKHMEDHQLNKGFKSRQEWSMGSKQVVMIGRPHLDLCFQDRLMLNGIDIKMRLVRSKDAFSLMGEGKVKIEDVALFVRKVKVDPSVQLDHIRGMERMSAKYPLCRVETKVFSVPKHNMMANQENLFLGQLPKRIVIGMVENTAFNGDKGKNPYNFQHFDVNYLALHVDGKQIPAKPLTPKFDDKLCTRSYASLFTGTGFMGHDRGNHISRDEYGNGFTLFAFDLTPDLDEGGHFHLVKQGNLRLELHFATQLPETINVIVYAEFDNVIEVDKARNVLFDYSAWIVTSWHPYWSKIIIRLHCSVGSFRSTASHPSETGYMSSIQLLTVTLGCIGQLSMWKATRSSILTVMGEIPHPCCDDGARKNDGWVIPSPCRAHWHQCVGSIVYTICFTVLEGSIWPPCLWILEPMWMIMIKWSMISWKIATAWSI